MASSGLSLSARCQIRVAAYRRKGVLKMFARIGNLKAEDLVRVLDLWEADEEQEKEFVENSKTYSKTNRAFDVQYSIEKGANCDDNEWDIRDSEGNDQFYAVEIEYSELCELAEVEYAEVEKVVHEVTAKDGTVYEVDLLNPADPNMEFRKKGEKDWHDGLWTSFCKSTGVDMDAFAGTNDYDLIEAGIPLK